MRRVGISLQINLALILTIIVAFAFLVTLTFRTEKAGQATASALDTLLSQNLLARELQVDFNRQVRAWQSVLLYGSDKSAFETHQSSYLSQQSKVAAGITALLESGVESEATTLVKNLQSDLSVLSDSNRKALDVYRSSGLATYLETDNLIRGLEDKPARRLGQLVDMLRSNIDAMVKDKQQQGRSEQRTILISAAIAFILIAAMFAYFLSKRLIRPMSILAQVAHQLSVDDYARKVPFTTWNDEIGTMAEALRVFRRNRISSLALQRSAQLSIETEEKEKLQALQNELDNERNAATQREKQHDQELAAASRAREAELNGRIERLSEAVAAAASGDLKYLAAHRETGIQADDDLSRMIADLENLFGQFDNDFDSISGEARILREASQTLSNLSEVINDGAQLNAEQSTLLLDSAETVRGAIIKMSEDISNMAKGIGTIESSAAQASVVANEAVDLGQRTDATMRKLSASSADIGNVIKLINSVAEQTNLLALNATIEAARAGDAGKGFAVVANEVKELAKETNKATEEIQRRIDAIRADTDHAVEAIGNINGIVSQINEIQLGISKSVKEQSQSADDIMMLVSSTLEDNKAVRGLITEINDRQVGAQSSAEQIHEASERLKQSASGSLELTARYAA